MKKYNHLGKALSRSEMKQILGGLVAGPKCMEGSPCKCVIFSGDVQTNAYGACAMSSLGTTISCYCDACDGDLISNGGRSRCWQ